MGKLEKKLQALLEIGDVSFYKVIDGGYGVSLDFYDKSYCLSHPADTIKQAVIEMHDNEWRVQAALKNPAWNQIAYKKYVDQLENYSD